MGGFTPRIGAVDRNTLMGRRSYFNPAIPEDPDSSKPTIVAVSNEMIKEGAVDTAVCKAKKKHRRIVITIKSPFAKRLFGLR